MLREGDEVAVDQGVDTLLLIVAVEATEPELDVSQGRNLALLLGADPVARGVVPVGPQHRQLRGFPRHLHEQFDGQCRLQHGAGAGWCATAQLAALGV